MAHTDLGPSYWARQAKGDLIVAYGPYDVRRIAAGAGALFASGANAIPAFRAITASDITNRTRNKFYDGSLFTTAVGTPAHGIQGANTRYAAWALDGASTEGVLTQTMMPEDYVSGAVTLKLHWTNLSAGSGNVVWQMAMRNTATTENLDTVAFTTANDTIAAPAQNVLKISTMSLSFTPDAGEQVGIYVIRLGGDAADTLDANDAGFIGIEMEYTGDS